MHVGIRGPLYAKSDLEDDERLGFSMVTSEYVEEHGLAAAIDRMRARIGDAPLYMSIDIDVLDPAHAPGTGTPEAGGLTSRELLRMIRALSDREHRRRRHRRGRARLRPRAAHRRRGEPRGLRAHQRDGAARRPALRGLTSTPTHPHPHPNPEAKEPHR